MSRTQCYEWFKHFKEGRMSAGEDPRPGQLSTSTNEDHVERVHSVIHELLANANGNENFLKNVVTGDETWVYGYDVETKMQSSQWMGKGSP